MPEFLTSWLGSNSLLPNGYCYRWQPELIGLHLASDWLLALAYYSLPLLMLYFLRRRHDLPFSWVLWLFSAFLVACGTSYLLDAWTIWYPGYWLLGSVKAITALISIYTVIVLVPLLPQALTIPSPAQLEAANQQLEAEIRDRRTAEAQILQLNAELEQRVSQRTTELQESEEHFRLLVDGVKDYALLMLDPNGHIVSWNSGAQRILGYSAEEIIGQNCECFYLPEDIQQGKPKQNLQIALAEGRLEQESWRVRKDGSRFWANVVTTPLTDETGQLRGFSKVTRDATQRKITQDKLTRLSHAIALTGSAIRMSDLQGYSIYHNQAFIDLYGYTVEEFNAKGGPEGVYTHPEIAKQVYDTLKKGDSWCGEVELRSKSGRLILTLLRADCIVDPEGNRLGFVGVCTDITNRKQAELALQQAKAELEIRVEERTKELREVIAQLQSEIAYRQQAEAELQALFAGMTDLIVVLDREGRYLKIAPTNPPLAYKPHPEAIGKTLSDIFPPAEANFFLHHIQKALDTQQPVNIEYSWQIQQQVFWFSATISPMFANSAIWVARDITTGKQAEAALQQQLQRTLLLKQITEQIRGSLNTQQICQTTVTQVGQALRANRCLISAYIPTPVPRLPLMAEYLEGDYQSLVGLEMSVNGNPHTQTLLTQDRAVAIDDVYAEPLLQPITSICQQIEVKSWLAVRTSYQGEPNGLLSLHQCDSYRHWQQEEIELIEAVAAQVGIALAQAQAINRVSTLLEQQTQASKQLSQQNLALRQSQTRLQEKNEQLKEALQELKHTQAQLIQTEKMSSLGQLVAGVAHEINNPVNFIYGNISHAHAYFHDLLRLIQLYQQQYPHPLPEIQALQEEIELDFLLQDTPKILESMQIGAERIREIVVSLRNFSRLDEAEMKLVDIHEGLDSTLLILQNRLKEKPGRAAIAVIKEYGDLPKVECYPGQLNQVFMNLLSNAIDVLETEFPPRTITISTEIRTSNEKHQPGESDETNNGNAYSVHSETLTLHPVNQSQWPLSEHQFVVIRIADNGPGMTPAVCRRIFDPFFTTKPVGKGTGLGLSISYQIVVQKHGGVLKCFSEPGQGAMFVIELPVRPKFTPQLRPAE